MTLIIAMGNRDRGDDAVGPLIVERLPRPLPSGVTLVELGGDPLAALDLLAASSRVLAVDAIRSGGDVGVIRRFVGLAALQSVDGFATGTHDVGLPELFGIAMALGACPQDVVVFGVEGENFSLRQELSPRVEQAISDVAAEIAREIGVQPPSMGGAEPKVGA